MEKKQRPTVKEYFGEDATLDQVHNEYLNSPTLFRYAQALDNYIDEITDQPTPAPQGDWRERFRAEGFKMATIPVNPDFWEKWIESNVVTPLTSQIEELRAIKRPARREDEPRQQDYATSNLYYVAQWKYWLNKYEDAKSQIEEMRKEIAQKDEVIQRVFDNTSRQSTELEEAVFKIQKPK